MAVVGVVALAGIALLASGLLTARPGASPVASATANVGVPTLPPAPSALPTLAPGPSAQITGVVIAGNRYEAAFTTVGFTPLATGTHVHFFWDTVSPDQAGSPGTGPFVVYAGATPFTEFSPGTKPVGATAICIIVANPNHSVIPESGTCTVVP